MADKKSWRDYSKIYSSEQDASSKKTGNWRDYTSDKSAGGNASREWRQYADYDPTTIVSNNIVNRLNSWIKNHNSYITDYQKRYEGRKYTYEDAYVSDSAAWLDQVTQRRDISYKEADDILAYMYQNKEYIDAGWMSKIQQTIASAKGVQSKMLEGATNDSEYWAKFTPNEDQVAAGYTAEKLYGEWQADSKQYADDQVFDLEAGVLELEALKRDRDAWLADQEEKRKQSQSEETFWDKLGRWMGNTTDTSIPLAGANEQISGERYPDKKLKEYDDRIANLEERIERSRYVQGYEGYMDNINAADYVSGSQFVSTRTDVAKDDALYNFAMPGGGTSGPAYHTEMLFGDYLHDYINKQEDALDVATVNDVTKEKILLGFDDEFLQTMTKDEVGVYNYLYNTKGPEAARAFLSHIESDLKGREKALEQAYWAEQAKNDPVGMSVFSAMISPMKGVSYVGQVADMLDDGKLDKNAGYNRFSYIPSTIRSQVSTTIERSGNWGKVGSFAYNTGMSMADFLLTTAVSGGNQAMSLAIMGTGAAADATIAAKERGLEDWQAFTLGTIAGIAEVAMERISLGAWLDGDMSEGALKYILKNAFSEAGEEAGTSAVNLLADVMISGDKSEWKVAMQKYMDEGKSAQEAFGLVAAEQAAQIGLDALGGFLSGTAIGGGTYVGTSIDSAIKYGGIAKNKAFAQKLTDEGLELNPDSKYVQKMKGKVEKGKSLTGMQVRNILASNQEQITANDMKKIQQAAEKRLTDLGQTENVSKLAEIATKWATGQEITRAEQKLLAHSEYGSKVAHDLLEDSLVQEVNSEGYGKKAIRSILDKMASMEHPNAYKSLESRMEGETPAEVSDTGKAVIRGTDTEVDLTAPTFKQISDEGVVLDVNGKDVRSNEIDYASEDQGLAINAIGKIEHITPAAASALYAKLDMTKPVMAQLNGMDEAFTYGFYNYSEADLEAGIFAGNLTKDQLNDAYKLGQYVRGKSDTAKTDAYKAMRTAAQAEAEKAATEGKEAPGAKNLTLTYNKGNGEVVSIDEANLDDTKSGGVEWAKVLHKMGLGTKVEFFESYISDTMKVKDKKTGKMKAARVFINDAGVEQIAYSGVYRKSDGTIRIDLNAYNGRGFTLNALAHELTHFIQQWSDKKYKVLVDFLMKEYEKTDMTMHERVIREQNRLKEIRGEEVSYDEAYDEVVANAMNKMFDDGKMAEKLAKLKEQDKNLAEKLWEGFKKILAKFIGIYEKEGLFQDADVLVEMKETFDQLQNMFAEALVEASENYQASLTVSESQKNPTAEDGVRYSSSSYDYSKSFAEQLEDYQKGHFPKGDTLIVGATPEVFRKIGMAALPVTLNTTHVDYALNGTKDFDHHLGKALLEQLPEAIKKPVAIMTSGTKANSSIVAMLEIRHNGKQIVVPVAVDGFGMNNGLRIDSNAITSVYGKNYSISKVLHDAIDQENKGAFRLYYLDQNKATALLRGAKVPMPKMPATYDGGFIHSLTDPGSPVKSRISHATQSQQFKRWFGDWQNNPKAASKVVNADGTPMVMYHGSPAQFTIFDKKKAKSSGQYGRGFYFTNSQSHAGTYGQQYSVYLNIRNPLEHGRDTVSRAQVQKFVEIVAENEDYSIENYGSYDVDAILNTIMGKSKAIDAFQVIQDINATAIGDMVEATELFNQVAGTEFDGIVVPTETVAFYPNQVKSATDNIGTFDGSNPDIRYSSQETDRDFDGRSYAEMGKRFGENGLDNSSVGNENKLTENQARGEVNDNRRIRKVPSAEEGNRVADRQGKPTDRGRHPKDAGVAQETKVWRDLDPSVRKRSVWVVNSHIKNSKNAGEIYDYLVNLTGKSESEITTKLYNKAVSDLTEELYSSAMNDHPVIFENRWSFMGETSNLRTGILEVVQENLNVGEQYSSQQTDLDSDGNELSKDQQKYFANSVVRDADGNLMVMYHGTANGGAFTVFDGDKLDNSSLKSQIGQGFYFTNMKNEAESYMTNVDIYGRVSKGKNPNLHQVYLNITNPFDINTDKLDLEKVKAVYMDGTSSHFFDSFISHYLNNKTVNGRTVTRAEVQAMSKADRVSLYVDYMAQIGTKELLSNMVQAFSYGKQSALLKAMQNRLGYDGIVEEYAPGKFQYVAFSSEQVKYVDNKKPTTNPDIRYSSQETDRDLDGKSYAEIEEERQELFQRERDLLNRKRTAESNPELVQAMDDYSALFDEARSLFAKRHKGTATQAELDRVEEIKALREERLKHVSELQESLGLGAMEQEMYKIRAEKEALRIAADEAWAREGAEKENLAIKKSGVSAPEYFRKKALKIFKTTTNFNEAGYLLPDGKLLNFSGGERNHRYRDHREIGEIYEATQGAAALNRFLSDGNIRIMAESPGIDLPAGVEPTREQYAELRRFINANGMKDGQFFVDFSGANGEIAGKYAYNGKIFADRIINDIRYFYQTGEIRESSGLTEFLYSSHETDVDGFNPDGKTLDEQLDDILKSAESFDGRYLYIGRITPTFINMLKEYIDIKDLPVVMNYRDAYLSMESKENGRYQGDGINYHNLGKEGMKRAIEAIGRPEQVMLSKKSGKIELVLECVDYKGDKFLSIIALNASARNAKKFIEAHIVTSIYGRRSMDKYVAKAEREGRLIYNKKEETVQGISQVQYEGNINTDSSKTNISRESKEVKSEHETDYSNRSLLANAFEGITKSSVEYELIQEYKGRIKLLNEQEEKLSKLNAEIRKIRFGKGEYDAQKLRELEAEAKNVAQAINRQDKKLLSLEASEPLRKVIERERKKEAQRTKDHVKEIQQNKKVRAEQTELRHKIRKTIRDLDKILNRGNKKQNVKEDMKGFASKALELADYLFTDHISNDDLIRKGITVRMTPKEAALVKETEDILSKLYDNADSLTDEEFTQLDAKRKANEDKLRDLLTAQRNERLNTPVYNLFNDLVTEYAKLQNSKQDAVRAAYNVDLERLLRQFMGDTTDNTDTDRKTLLQNMRVADMTTAELQKLLEAYKMVLTNVRDANKVFAKSSAASIEEIANKVTSDFYNRKTPDGKVATVIRNLSNKLGWDYEKLHYALDRIGSEAFTELVMNIADSENIVMQDIMEAVAFRDEMIEKYGFNNWAVNKEIDREFMDNTGKKFKLTLGQLMALYAYSRREGAWDHIEYGGFVFGDAALTNPRPADSYKLTKDQCEAITGLLTKEQKGYAEDMQKYLSETMGEKGNDVSMLLYGIKMFGEKNYFPIHVAGQFKAQANESQAKAAAGFSSMSNAGFTHAQNPNAKAPFVLEGFNEIWADHVNEMSRYHGTVPALEDLRRVMNRSTYSDSVSESQSIKQLMENHYGKEAVDYFDNLYREANSGAITDKLQNKAKKLLSLFRKNSVAYSLSVIIQQPTALVRAYAMIDKKYFGFKGFGAITSGVAKAVSSKWNPAYANAYNEMLKYAPGVTMAKEIGGFDTATGGSIRSTLLDTGKSLKQKWNTGTALEKGKAVLDVVDNNAIANLPNVADKIAWIEIWNACKRETVATHKDLAPNSDEFMQAVGKRFTEVIRATQVYDSIFAKSPMLKSKNLGVQMLVSFMNEPNTVANMVEKSVRDVTKGDWKGGLRTGAAVIYSIIFNNVLKSIIYALRDDDEDETYIEKYIEAITGGMMDDFNALNYIPLVRDAWSIAQGYDVERADMAIVSDAVNAFVNVLKYASKDTEGMTEEQLIELDKKQTESGWKLVESLAAFLGIPVKNIRREINGVLDHARIASANAGNTTAQSVWDTISDAVIDSIPFMSNKESKTEKLYDAIVNGDTAYRDRIKNTYKDEDAYNSAVRKSLRENDSRIHDAAQARYDGNMDEYKRIFREIQNEGKFSFDEIMDAVNSEVSAIKNKLEPEKATSSYDTSDFVEAVSMGDTDSAKAIKDDLIATYVANGKTQKEAEQAFESGVKSSIGDAYSGGLLDETEAKNMLMEYTDMEEEDAVSRVSYWAFCDENPKYAKDITEAKYNKYKEFAEPANISLDVFVQYINGTKGLANIKDEWGDVEVTEREQVLEVIDSLDLTWQQKDALYLAAGYAESKIWDVPW